MDSKDLRELQEVVNVPSNGLFDDVTKMAVISKLREVGLMPISSTLYEFEDRENLQKTVGAYPDGSLGGSSFDAIVAFFRLKGLMKSPQTVFEKRKLVVNVARSYLGEQQPDFFYKDCATQFVGTLPNKVSWCGVFALHVLRKALGIDIVWETGKGFLYKLPMTKIPEIGDIAYFDKNQHHAIVASSSVGGLTLINGNGMTSPKEGVTQTFIPRSSIKAFYSIAKFL